MSRHERLGGTSTGFCQEKKGSDTDRETGRQMYMHTGRVREGKIKQLNPAKGSRESTAKNNQTSRTGREQKH